MPLDHTQAGFKPASVGSNAILECKTAVEKRALYTAPYTSAGGDGEGWAAEFMVESEHCTQWTI
jgi:hypothetical protein